MYKRNEVGSQTWKQWQTYRLEGQNFGYLDQDGVSGKVRVQNLTSGQFGRAKEKQASKVTSKSPQKETRQRGVRIGNINGEVEDQSQMMSLFR